MNPTVEIAILAIIMLVLMGGFVLVITVTNRMDNRQRRQASPSPLQQIANQLRSIRVVLVLFAVVLFFVLVLQTCNAFQ